VLIEQLNELWNSGRLLATHPVTSSEEHDELILAWLATVEPSYRQQLPGDPPASIPQVSVWAARQFFRAAQLVVHRELGESFIQSGLETEPIQKRDSPWATNPSLHYSVDLHFRFLPDLVRLAKAMSRTDPLLDQLNAWMIRWPLSGARIAGLPPEESERLEPILRDPCLRIVYIERRLSDPEISKSEIAYWHQVLEQREWSSLANQ
jgi:hypothetical protein